MDAVTATDMADHAQQAIRALNHDTTRRTVAANEAYAILDSLKDVAHALPQTLDQLSAGLQQSLAEYDVYETTGGDPDVVVAYARTLLEQAAATVALVGQHLEEAQSVLAYQAYRPNASANPGDTSGQAPHPGRQPGHEPMTGHQLSATMRERPQTVPPA